ncbi:MAG TPA: D-alanyl-D-alanine carboxypeptidase/D-alanyl-D-alanine-endopeptidase [Acidimicrobiales bacterium]|nr:D-alanyl-D-alanine carboxypeptidase/D-alanyl-D-alanine-endopeptidase [Acidimicrobiales bacterium]
MNQSARQRLLLALVGVVGVAAAVLAVATRPPADPASTPGDGTRISTPLFSARRVPELVVRELADARLRARLEAALRDPAFGSAGSESCLLVTQAGRRIESIRPDLELIPASNLKLLTAAAVLAHFGDDHRFTTEFRAAAPPVDGVIAGDLWLVGGGDPVLLTPDYAASLRYQPALVHDVAELGRALVQAGVREVRGALLGDESRYDRVRYIPTWKPGYAAAGEVGPASALLINDGFASFGVRRVAASDPAAHAAGMAAAAAEAAGVVLGAVGSGTAPKAAVVVASVESPPLSSIVESLLRESDNTTAEVLLKELGLAVRGQGTTAAGLDAMREVLAAEGIAADSYVVTDGSGLDRGNRASCLAIDRALSGEGSGGPMGRGLAIAAQTGTLGKRFQNTPAAGRLHAKTGALEGVVSLSGWIRPPRGSPLDFSFIANGIPGESRGRQLQDRIGVALALYPEAPAADAVGPVSGEG